MQNPSLSMKITFISLNPIALLAKRKLFVFLFLIAATNLFVQAQNQRIERLQQALSNHQEEDSLTVDLLNELSQELWRTDPKNALRYARQGMSLSQSLGYKKWLGHSNYFLGWSFYHLGQYDSALLYLQQGYSMSKYLDDLLVSNVVNSIGQTYWRTGDLDSAVFYIEQAKTMTNDSSAIARALVMLAQIESSRGNLTESLVQYEKVLEVQKVIDSSNVARTMYSIASTYSDLGDSPKAFGLLEEAQEWAIAVGDQPVLAGIYAFKGSILANQEEYQRARQLHEKALEINQTLGRMISATYNLLDIGLLYDDQDQNLEAHQYFVQAAAMAQQTQGVLPKLAAFQTLADSYVQLGKYDSALVYARPAYELSKDIEYNQKIAIGASVLAWVYIELGQWKNAEKLLQEAEQIADESGFLSIKIRIAQRFIRLYKVSRQPWKALHYSELHGILQDSLLNEDKVREISTMEAQFAFDKEKQQIAADQAQTELLYQQDLQEQKNIQYAAFAGLFVFLLIIGLIFRFYQVKKRDNALLTEKNLQITEQTEALTQQSATLKATNEQLHELSRFKEGFTQMIVHDMKNSLNTIIVSTEKALKDEAQHIHLAGRQLLQLITNMLEIQKFEEAKPRLQRTEVMTNQLLETALGSVSLLAREKAISFQIHKTTDFLLRIDEQRMVHVLVNLLSNAIKYTPSNSVIQIDMQEAGGKVHLAVTDTGEGIAREDLPHIFDKFWQSKATNSGIAHSTGLGLSYCKLAVEAHDGEISVTSTPGAGSTFSIDLPYVSVVETANEGKTAAETEIHHLILEDESSIISQFAQRFKSLKIYQASHLMQILQEMDHLQLKSSWLDEIKAAIYHRNKEMYQQLVEGAFLDPGF